MIPLSTNSLSEFLDVICKFIMSNLIIRIRSNFYNGLDGSDPLLGVDKDIKKVKILLVVGIICNDE